MLSSIYRLLSPRTGRQTLAAWTRLSHYSTDSAVVDIRSRLMTDLKASMKARDTFASTTIRSVLAEVYAADKTAPEQKIDSSAIILLISKANARRADSAAQFTAASRPDLAENEQREADFLSQFLPSLLPEAEVDSVLMEIISNQVATSQDDPRKVIGKVLKAFYAQVNRSTVDTSLVKQRAEALLAD